jgi:hypothetical protein
MRRYVMIYCSRCKELKECENFAKNKSRKNGLSNWCRPCTAEYRAGRDSDYLKNWHLLNRYGLTIEDRDAMLLMQGGRCAICRTNKTVGRYWHVDHCHNSNEVRALLCFTCNIVVGKVEDGWCVEVPAINHYLEMYS